MIKTYHSKKNLNTFCGGKNIYMEIKTYLKNAMELEQILFTLNKSINYLKYSMKDLGIQKKYEKPKEPDTSEASLWGETISLTFVTVCFIGVPGGLIFINMNLFDNISSSTKFFSFIIIIALLSFIFFERGVRSENITKLQDYEKRLDTYNILSQKDDLRVQKELKKKSIINQQIIDLQNKKKEISSTLNKLYNLNIIYPKYRNFVAVATFYEYFESGRCVELVGHAGAYNRYEDEIRLNVIISKLDDIVNQLESIRGNQYMIYEAISEGNRVANEIYKLSAQNVDNLKQISENTAIASYNSRITAENTEMLKYIEIFDRL